MLTEAIDERPRGAQIDYAIKNVQLCQEHFPDLYQARNSRDKIRASVQARLDLIDKAILSDKSFEGIPLSNDPLAAAKELVAMEYAEIDRIRDIRKRIDAIRDMHVAVSMLAPSKRMLTSALQRPPLAPRSSGP